MQQASDTIPQSADALASTDERDRLAAEVVNRYPGWAAAAAIIPVPFLDVAAVAGVQLKMLRELAAIYDVEFSDNIGKSLVAALVGSIVPAGAAPVAAMGFVSALKFVPVVGFTLASISMPLLSAAATYGVGKVFIQHFSAGGTLLDFNPADYREFMRQQSEKAKAKDFSATASSSTSSGTA
jgi:uncharacterized protein (DUF697 family)